MRQAIKKVVLGAAVLGGLALGFASTASAHEGIRLGGRGRWVTVERVVQLPGRYETRTEMVTIPGHYDQVARQVWDGHCYTTVYDQVWTPPRCESRQVQVWVPGGTRVVRERQYVSR